MKFDDLVFENKGCCAEYRVAEVKQGGTTRYVYDDEGGYRTMVTKDGVLIADSLQTGLTKAEIEKLL